MCAETRKLSHEKKPLFQTGGGESVAELLGAGFLQRSVGSWGSQRMLNKPSRMVTSEGM